MSIGVGPSSSDIRSIPLSRKVTLPAVISSATRQAAAFAKKHAGMTLLVGVATAIVVGALGPQDEFVDKVLAGLLAGVLVVPVLLLIYWLFSLATAPRNIKLGWPLTEILIPEKIIHGRAYERRRIEELAYLARTISGDDLSSLQKKLNGVFIRLKGPVGDLNSESSRVDLQLWRAGHQIGRTWSIACFLSKISARQIPQLQVGEVVELEGRIRYIIRFGIQVEDCTVLGIETKP